MSRFAIKFLRQYKPHGYLDGLPPSWVRPLAADYEALGYRVETGEDWLRVFGVSRHELCCRINDPLGVPGEQDPRNPQTTTKRHRPKVDAAPARGRKRRKNQPRRLLGRRPLPLPGSQGAVRRAKEQRQQEEADSLIAEERRYLRPDDDPDEVADD
jgi:hypothetical protein